LSGGRKIKSLWPTEVFFTVPESRIVSQPLPFLSVADKKECFRSILFLKKSDDSALALALLRIRYNWWHSQYKINVCGRHNGTRE
jgi:hypothetical protein